MKKETYLINCIKGRGEKDYKTVNGYTEILTDSSGNYIKVGYHYNHDCRTWIATELLTGFKCAPASITKKTDLITWVHTHGDLIKEKLNNILTGETGANWVQPFREYANNMGLNTPYYN